MLTRADMQRVARARPTAQQLALDQILPTINKEIRTAAEQGLSRCSVDIPAFLDTAPAFDYAEVCARVVQTLKKGAFTVQTRQLGLYEVSWGADKKDPATTPEDEVRIVYSSGKGRRKRT